MAEIVNRAILKYNVILPTGKVIEKKIQFGSNNARHMFDKKKLEEAFERIKKDYGNKLGDMNMKTIKVLTWEHYQKEDPVKYKPSREDKVIEDEPPLMKESITLINPYTENGSSALLLGGSNTGKTTLLVQAIKNILTDHKKRYDMIIIFSESISSIPLQDLPHHEKIIIFPIFIPQLVSFLIKVNQATDCRYSILIILDDVILLKNKMVDKLILVARNYGISTIISTQKLTGLSPAARESIHNSYILGGRNPERRDDIVKKYIRGFLFERGIKKKEDMDAWLRENTKLGETSRKLIKINAIKDIMSVHEIQK